MAAAQFYVFLDADKVGDRLELFLLKGSIPEAEQLHESVQTALKEIRSRVQGEGFDVLLSGCDDVLFSGPSPLYRRDFLEELRAFFVKATRCTLSCGVGLSIADALQNLRIAKLEGRDRVAEQNVG